MHFKRRTQEKEILIELWIETKQNKTKKLDVYVCSTFNTFAGLLSLFVVRRSSPMIMICMHAQWCASTFKYGAHLGILQIRIKCIYPQQCVYIYSLSFTCLLRITFGLLKRNIYFWLSHFSIRFGIGSGSGSGLNSRRPTYKYVHRQRLVCSFSVLTWMNCFIESVYGPGQWHNITTNTDIIDYHGQAHT